MSAVPKQEKKKAEVRVVRSQQPKEIKKVLNSVPNVELLSSSDLTALAACKSY
jgi:hypothetical protein